MSRAGRSGSDENEGASVGRKMEVSQWSAASADCWLLTADCLIAQGDIELEVVEAVVRFVEVAVAGVDDFEGSGESETVGEREVIEEADVDETVEMGANEDVGGVVGDGVRPGVGRETNAIGPVEGTYEGALQGAGESEAVAGGAVPDMGVVGTDTHEGVTPEAVPEDGGVGLLPEGGDVDACGR